jgi:hypothetical protein
MKWPDEPPRRIWSAKTPAGNNSIRLYSISPCGLATLGPVFQVLLEDNRMPNRLVHLARVH